MKKLFNNWGPCPATQTGHCSLREFAVIAAVVGLVIANCIPVCGDDLLFANREAFQRNIDLVIRPTLLNAFMPTERKIAESVRIVIKTDPGVSSAKAFDDGNRRIEISTGFISLVSELAEAQIVAAQFSRLNYVFPYYKRLAKFLNCPHGNVPFPEPFWQLAKVNEKDYRKFRSTEKYKVSMNNSVRNVLLYVLCHEYGHLVLGHLTTRAPRKPIPIAGEEPTTEEIQNVRRVEGEDSRRNEDEADDFAIRVNWVSLNVDPIMVVPYFALFGIVEDNPIPGRMAQPSVSRFEKFLDAALKCGENSADLVRDPKMRDAYMTLKTMHGKIKSMCQDAGIVASTSIPIGR